MNKLIEAMLIRTPVDSLRPEEYFEKVSRHVYEDHDFIDEDLPEVEPSNDPARDMTTPVNIILDNPIPEPRAVVTPQSQSVNEPLPQSVDGHHQTAQLGVPTPTMIDSTVSPSTSSRSYFTPKELQPIPRLSKPVSNRGRKATKPTILTSSPYKQDLETSIQKNIKKNTLKTAPKKSQRKCQKKNSPKEKKYSKQRKSSSASSDKSD
ncbi:hypothetical protein WA026_015791 [Henosepilachna vigintioctopunctata]|uniref:Uncharacterized protein n=1 Tax=Henosepilachna vigintioctopunctata TaxID=420089 RepID=A0AAW1V217_9CUCU